MKPNVFLRSMFRQPVRVFLLATIVGIAAFAFSLRASESAIVNSEIARIEAYFRSVGFLMTADPDDWFNSLDFNDYRWQEIISQSPYVERIDHRRLLTGELEGIMNADIDRIGFRYIPLYPTYLVRDAYFIGTVLHARAVTDLTPSSFFPQFPDILSSGSARAMGVGTLIELLVHVDEVIMAYPEYAQAGRRIFLMMPYDEFEGIDVGGQYLFRGFWDYDLAALAGDESIPEFGYEGTNGLHRLGNGPRSFTANSRGLDYVSLLAGPLIPQGDIYRVSYGSSAFDDIIAQLSGYLDILERNLSAMIAVTTKDMYAMYPHESNAGELRGLGAGRLITYEDYQSANAVAVVHSAFAETRGLSIGDTIELTLRENVPLALPHDYIGWQEYRTYTLSLEIIGIYRIGFSDIIYSHPDITWAGYDPRMHGIITTVGIPEYTVSTFLYIPESLIPEGFYFYREVIPGDNLFSFLVNSRNEPAFFAENRDALFELGLTLHFASNPFAATFFESSDAIAEALWLNFVIFTIAAVFALILAAFIYTMLMRRSFAISRVLGTSRGACMRQMFFSASLVWLPIAIAGAIIGFYVSIDVAQESLVQVYDLQPHLQADPIPSRLWFFGLIAISSAATMLSVLVGSFILAKHPLLRILARR